MLAPAFGPFFELRRSLDAIIELLRAADEDQRENLAVETSVSTYAERLCHLLGSLSDAPEALDIVSELMDLIALLILLKSARLVEKLLRPPNDEAARAALMRVIRERARALRDEIDARWLPLEPLRPPSEQAEAAGPGPGAQDEVRYEWVSFDEIADTLDQVLGEMERTPHEVRMERPTVQEMIEKLLALLRNGSALVLQQIWGREPLERVAALLATLDLAFRKKVRIEQTEPGAEVYVLAVKLL